MTLMSPESINLMLQIAGGAAAAAASLWGFLRWIWPQISSLWCRVRDRMEARALIQLGMAKLPEALERLRHMDLIQSQLTLITRQVMPNGGSSLSDALARVEKNITALQEQAELRSVQITTIGKQVAMVGMTMKATIEANASMATFDVSDRGLMTEANKTLLRWTGMQLIDVKNWGWVNFVHPIDRVRVRGEWNQAVADVRALKVKFAMLDESGTSFDVELTMTPIPEGASPCDKFVGVIYRTSPG